MRPDPNKAPAPLNYRLTVLRVLMKVAKETKSFIQQKTATKMKKASQKIKNDPTDQKAQKSFAKFEKKLQLIKTIHGPEIRAAAFIYAKFDFEINFDSVKDKVTKMMETDPDELVKRVFEQLKDENSVKEPYLLFYQILKEKPHKRFTDTVKNLRKFVEKHENWKDSKKIKKKAQIQNKLAKRANVAEKGEGENENQGIKEDGEEEPSHEFVSVNHKGRAPNGKNFQAGGYANPNAPKEKKYIEKNRDKNRKQNDRDFGNNRFGRGQRFNRAPLGGNTESGSGQKYHPSFQAKIEKRRQQKATNFSGEVVDL